MISEISFRIVSFRALFYFAISCTRFRASCIIIYSCVHESSRDLVRDIVRNFARFCTIYCLGFCEISCEFSRVEYNVLKYY